VSEGEAVNIRLDPNYNEPKPKRWHKIHCFDCKKDLFSKAMAVKGHQGHDVHYVNERGEVDE